MPLVFMVDYFCTSCTSLLDTAGVFTTATCLDDMQSEQLHKVALSEVDVLWSRNLQERNSGIYAEISKLEGTTITINVTQLQVVDNTSVILTYCFSWDNICAEKELVIELAAAATAYQIDFLFGYSRWKSTSSRLVVNNSTTTWHMSLTTYASALGDANLYHHSFFVNGHSHKHCNLSEPKKIFHLRLSKNHSTH